MKQESLLDRLDAMLFTPSYPKSAGFKDPTTSKDAALAIEGAGRAAILRER